VSPTGNRSGRRPEPRKSSPAQTRPSASRADVVANRPEWPRGPGTATSAVTARSRGVTGCRRSGHPGSLANRMRRACCCQEKVAARIDCWPTAGRRVSEPTSKFILHDRRMSGRRKILGLHPHPVRVARERGVHAIHTQGAASQFSGGCEFTLTASRVTFATTCPGRSLLIRATKGLLMQMGCVSRIGLFIAVMTLSWSAAAEPTDIPSWREFE